MNSCSAEVLYFIFRVLHLLFVLSASVSSALLATGVWWLYFSKLINFFLHFLAILKLHLVIFCLCLESTASPLFNSILFLVSLRGDIAAAPF